MTRPNVTSWPLKPNMRTSAGVLAADPGVRTQVCRGELQDGLAPRPWRVLVVNNGPAAANFYVVVGDAYGTSQIGDGVTIRTMTIDAVPGFGAAPALPFAGNWFSCVVVGRSVSVYAAPVAPFAGTYENVFAAVAPEGLTYPLMEP